MNFLSDLFEVRHPDELLEIEPLYLPELTSALQMLIRKSLPALDPGENFYEKLRESLPHIAWTKTGNTISITTLCEANYTPGIERFLIDAYTHWAIPGKQLPIAYIHATTFRFLRYPMPFFVHELLLKLDHKKELSLVLERLPSLAKEVSLNISAVQHARRVISLKPLTTDQKRIIIQENITSLLHRGTHDLFDQTHQFLMKVAAEDKVSQIKDRMAPLLEFQPEMFDRDLFNDLQTITQLLKDDFISEKNLSYLSRIVVYTHLFRKLLNHNIAAQPNRRHLLVKLLHDRPSIGVLVGINLLRDTEIIGEKHLIKAIQSILPVHIRKSFFIGHTSAKLLYIEIEKSDTPFSLEEIKVLKKRLPREIKTRIESVLNPIFMPRNEEEVMRNILVLNNQLKIPQDIPHVIISFHKQTDAKLTFSIILLRVLKPDDKPLAKLFPKFRSKAQFTDHDVKTVGLIRKRYPKEANVFDIHVEKKHFLRKDFSVDLSQARRHIFLILSDLLGEIRDYNGGMISKQNEVLNDLKKLLLQMNIRNDFLLENFFYSLVPNYMQSIAKPLILKKLFLLVLEALEHDFGNQFYFLKTQIVEDHFLITLGAINPTLKDFIEERIESVDLEGAQLTTSFVNTYDISCLSYLLKFTDSDQHQRLLQRIIESIKIWKETLSIAIGS